MLTMHVRQPFSGYVTFDVEGRTREEVRDLAVRRLVALRLLFVLAPEAVPKGDRGDGEEVPSFTVRGTPVGGRAFALSPRGGAPECTLEGFEESAGESCQELGQEPRQDPRQEPESAADSV